MPQVARLTSKQTPRPDRFVFPVPSRESQFLGLMPAFEVYDTVVLKTDKALVGTVERTCDSPDGYDPLDDRLIVAHVEVPPAVLTEFVTTGSPPRGYAFVCFANEENGSSLVSEEDIRLLCRSFDIGDYVQRDDGPMTGTVVSVSESYTLQPVCSLQPGEKLSQESFTGTATRPASSPDCAPRQPHFHHPRPNTLIYNVPGQDLKRAHDVVEGDAVIYRDWVGTVEEVEMDVVVALENNSVVVLSDMLDMHVPIPDLDKPLVSLPEMDDITRPDVLVALQGWGTTIPTTDPRPGTFIVTNRNSLRRGRWIQGSYDANIAPQGVVLSVLAHKIHVQWLTCNAFASKIANEMKPPPPSLSVYDGMKNFCTASDLRRKKSVIIHDPGRQPRHSSTKFADGLDKATSQESVCSPPLAGSKSSGPSQDLRVGDHVRFRDVTAAAVKYQGLRGTSQGQFNRILVDATFGWDLNELRVVSIDQEVTILWQDGTISTSHSRAFKKLVTFEMELSPTDLVLGRTGMKQRPSGLRSGGKQSVTNFDEMKMFERSHDLLPDKVGIIQSVDPKDRVAKVRWYQKPHIQLLEAGSVLSPKSHFGPIGDVIEDVSLYEIMTFPALSRHLKDLAIIPPGSTAKGAIGISRSEDTTHSNSSSDPLRITASYLAGHLFLQAQHVEPTHNLHNTSQEIDDTTKEPPADSNDWIGEIIALGLDGTITLRLCGVNPCRDTIISHDEILAIIDDDDVYDIMDDDDDLMELNEDEDDHDEYDEDEEYDEYNYNYRAPVLESIEYEGGQRLDDDSGDENWVSDGEDRKGDRLSNSEIRDVSMHDVEVSGLESEHDTRQESSSNLMKLRGYVPTKRPLSFEVLDREPPADQFCQSSDASSNVLFLKRIMREHRILSKALPEGEIYVRTFENRLDLMRCLILGPRDTPYEDAPFMVDLHLGSNFPQEPPTAHFHSWTSGLGRINPNLYEGGKICLSLLGTWPGKSEGESWSEKATILQILVSLQGLVFVRNPFYNEAGFEDLEAEGGYSLKSQQYSEKAFVIARGFVKHALFRPPQGVEDILAWLYLANHEPQAPGGLLQRILDRANALMEKSQAARAQGIDELLDGRGEADSGTTAFLKPLSKGAMVMLQRTVKELKNSLDEADNSAT